MSRTVTANEFEHPSAQGPWAGFRVIEFEALGPGPFCAMLLADMGADVTLLERPGVSPARTSMGDDRQRVVHRGKPSLGIDLKRPGTVDLAPRLVERADVLIIHEQNRIDTLLDRNNCLFECFQCHIIHCDI